jgi:phospholipase C
MKCFSNINWNESSGFFCDLLKQSSTTSQEIGVRNWIVKTVLPLALMAALAPVTALAQSNNIPQVQHVIIVVQENRTPTNLFHEDTTLIANGAHVRPANDSGSCGAILQNPVKGCAPATPDGLLIPLAPTPLAAPNYGPNHEHYPDWQCTFDNGAMDGACHATETKINGTIPCPSGNPQYCPYTYVSDSAIQPYFQIAEQYGFANWMSQTNQGPSQPAHLFLFAGTSAPDYFPNDNTYGQYWISDNGPGQFPGGCLAETGTKVPELPPAPPQWPNFSANPYIPGTGVNPGYPCWNPNTMADLLDLNQISWRYYANVNGEAYWNAPISINHICKPNMLPGTVCTGTDYKNNVYTQNPGQVLNDMGYQGACNLQAVSRVIPDGSWSDHPGNGSTDFGPSWVASIVNALGGYTNKGAQFKPCTDANGTPYWQDTVVLVVWDDWGGWYDDVLPWRCSPTGACQGYPGQQHSEDYVYGFRVPLLVVGAYVVRSTDPSGGYISGTADQGGEVQRYVHDFGSILNFIEYAFGTGRKPLGGTYGIGGQAYPYADYFAPDGPNAGCGATTCPFGLSDFFDFNQSPRSFVQIPAPYDTSCFTNPMSCFGSGYKP